LSLKDIFHTAANIAFKVFESVNVNCTYIVTGTKAYNATTGAITKTDVNHTSQKFIFSNYTQQEINDKTILNTHVKAMIPYDQFSVTSPKMEDKILATVSNIKYSIIDIKIDPAQALHIFQLEPID